MKDLGTLFYFLGLEINSSSDGYYISQAKYASDLLSKVGITDNKTISAPLEYNVMLTPLASEPIFNATRYRQLVGSIRVSSPGAQGHFVKGDSIISKYRIA